jgi:Xaa-Pro aminopeptidase
MPDLVLYGDTLRNPALRHEVPIAILDPFLYAEVNGRAHIMTTFIEHDRMAAVRPDAVLIDVNDLGFHELLRSGMSRDEVFLELTARTAARAGVQEAIVDFEFPLGVAERLRADGIRLTVDDPPLAMRRRVKSEGEMAGIRRAQRAAEAGMAAAAALLRRAEPEAGELSLDGGPLLAETVRAALRRACAEHGAAAPPDVIVASVRQGFGHEAGSGPLPAGLPIQIDLWPQDEESGCWADMTRTFVVGDPPEEVVRQERLVRESIEAVRAAIRPGVKGSELHALSCEVFEREGYRTQRTGPGEDPQEGFQFSLGHGVGLAVHEDPGLGPAGHQELVAGDVLAIEPGLWNRHVGGVRYEDLVLVTTEGSETLTRYPYDLRP